ncbi:MAG: sigma-54 dependent transcriptional regulator [Calditrichia bacterium]
MNPKFGKVLIVDDDEDVLLAASLLLKKQVETVHTEKNPEMLPTLLKNENYDVILLDMNFTRDVTSGTEGFHWLQKVMEIDSSAVVILITAYGDVEMAVRAVKEGATDFILKPWQNEKLLATVSAALQLRRSRREVDRLRSQQQQLSADIDEQFQNIIGTDSSMKRVFSLISKVAGTDANVLILGENGTGKELVARAVHRESRRTGNVFIRVDLGAISESLFESELFGHVKGAFTDARQDRAGRFEVASGGTLLLDEIGNLPVELQAKLLTVLQSRQVTRVGSNSSREIDIRLICATNMPIYEMVAKGKFRQDLLYRINTVEIPLPPLRERRKDIPLLADYFLETYRKKYGKTGLRFSPAALKKLETYHWPGNVRELQHAVERAVIMTENEVLQPGDFFFSVADSGGENVVLDDYNLEKVEKVVILKTLAKHNGNISHAAKELGLTRASLYRRMEKYGV